MKQSPSSAGTMEIVDRAPQQEDMYALAERGSKRGSGRWNLLVLTRRVHLYLGMFSAPAILFFALTGILQTLSLHEFSQGGSYEPPRWIVVLAQIHKKQTLEVPERKSVQPANAKVPGREKPKGIDAPVSSNGHQTTSMKIFFVVIGVGLILSTVTGIVMAWKFKRDRRMGLGLFIAGTFLPILLLVF
jgi:hypothetical protein